MHSATNQNAQSLSELVKDVSMREVIDVAPHLSLPEILIIGARPLHLQPRPASEVRQFGEIATQKLRELESMRRSVYGAIAKRYNTATLSAHNVSNYLEKQALLSSEAAITPQLLDVLRELVSAGMIDRKVVEEIERYKRFIPIYLQGNARSIPKGTATELEHMQQTPTNLVFYYQPAHANGEPYIIATKIKVSERIAGKIPYNMIKRYRKRNGRWRSQGSAFKKELRLKDGIIEDAVGVQVANFDRIGSERLKGYIYRHRSLEVVPDRQGVTEEDHAGDPSSTYSAIHINVIWNPLGPENPQMSNPHILPVEVILMTYPDFVRANFGPECYWRRMNAQRIGIVDPNLNNGVLKVDNFTPAELAWKTMVEQRILDIFSYNRPYRR